MQTARVWGYHGAMTGAELDYWTKWTIVLASTLGLVLMSFAWAGIWEWLDSRKK